MPVVGREKEKKSVMLQKKASSCLLSEKSTSLNWSVRKAGMKLKLIRKTVEAYVRLGGGNYTFL